MQQLHQVIDQRERFFPDLNPNVYEHNHKQLVHRYTSLTPMVYQLIYRNHDNRIEEYLYDMLDIINKHFED